MNVGGIGRWPFIATYIDVPCGQGPYSPFQNGPAALLNAGRGRIYVACATTGRAPIVSSSVHRDARARSTV